jgi:hypothetical protein
MSTLSIDTANYSLIGTQSYLIGTSASASSTITLYTDGACTVPFGSSTSTSTSTSTSYKWYFSLSGITPEVLYTVYAKEGTTISTGISIYVYTGQTNSNVLYGYNAVPPPSTYTGVYGATSSITTPTITTSGLVEESDRYLFSRTPSISGTSDPYAMIELFYSSTAFGLTQANAFGKWTYAYSSAEWNLSSSIPAGNTYFIAKAYDEDYNYSSDAEIAVTVIDSSTITKPSTPVISSSFSSTVTTSNTVTIAGTCEKGTNNLSKVTLSYGSGTTPFVKEIGSNDTEWSIDAYLPNGTYAFTATVTDAVGYESVSSTPVTVTVNVSSATTTAEITTIINTAEPAENITVTNTLLDPTFATQVNDTLTLSNYDPKTTSTALVALNGFVENSTPTGFATSTPTYLGTFTTDATGTVVITITATIVSLLGVGNHTLNIVDTVNKIVKTIPFVIVSTVANDPLVKTNLSYMNEITSITVAGASGSQSVSYSPGKIYISNKKITSISGKTTTTGTGTVSITKSGVTNQATLGDDRAWSYSIPSDGTYVISAGNATDKQIITLIIDTIPPAKPTIQTTANNTISGSAEANANVIIRENNKVLKTVAVSAQGNWFYKPDYAMPARPYNFSIVAQDAANNNSDANAFTNEFAFSMSKSLIKLVPGQPVNVNAVTRKTISDPTLSFSISPAILPAGLKFNKHSGKISGTFTGTAFPSQKYTITTRSSVFVRKTATVRMEMAPPN